jgi:APA family basic amino acid/polyamine antiporter
MPETVQRPELKRVLGLFALTVYGVGDVLGAGIYALVGKVAEISGPAAWLSFLVAAVVAVLTGLSYAELSSRQPFSAGAAGYCRRAFSHPIWAFLVGIFVLTSGLNSAATVSQAFVGYLNQFIEMPLLLASVGLLLLMSLLSFWGMRESSSANLVMTAVELSGLILVMVVGFWMASGLDSGQAWDRLAPTEGIGPVFTAATIAFFAYIGFEDLANVAEEAKDPVRTLPRAILIAIAVSCVFYMTVTVSALMAVTSQGLSTSETPLMSVLTSAGVPVSPQAFAVIALFAICNTGLLNLIMASRLAYGMACEGLLPAPLATVHPVRRTPWVGVVFAFILAALISATGQVRVLAQTTTLLLFFVFGMIHLSLIVLKKRTPNPGPQVFKIPVWIPYAGIVSCLFLASRSPLDAYLRALVALIIGLGLYVIAPARSKEGVEARA